MTSLAARVRCSLGEIQNVARQLARMPLVGHHDPPALARDLDGALAHLEDIILHMGLSLAEPEIARRDAAADLAEQRAAAAERRRREFAANPKQRAEDGRFI